MKISLFNNFGAKNSAPVFAAIEQGLKRQGHEVVHHDISADAAVIWSMLWVGRMRNNREVWREFSNRPVIVAEVGMLQRNVTWKLGLGGTGHNNYPKQIEDSNRQQLLGLQLHDWHSTGSHIVIACQRTDSEQWNQQPPINQWLQQTIEKIRQHTDRPIVVRPHPRGQAPMVTNCIIEKPHPIRDTYDDFDFMRSLGNAWAVVNYNSGPGPQAAINGVPVFVDKSSLASPVGNLDLSAIENPVTPDRNQWANWLAHTEWTLDEIKTGHPLARLLNSV